MDPHIEEYMTPIVDLWEETVRESPAREGSGCPVRGALRPCEDTRGREN